MKQILSATLLLLGSYMAVFAQQEIVIKNGKAASTDNFTIKFDNDVFAGTDKWYTNGLEFNWTLADIRTWDTPEDSTAWAQNNFSAKLPSWAQFLVSTLPFSEDYENNQYRLSFSLGQSFFTPANISIAAAQPDQRPWAGWTYLNTAFVVQGDNRMDILELSFGIVGPASGSEAVQKNLHDLIHSTKPEGWDNQLHNEFAFNLSYQRYWRFLLTEETKNTFGADFVGNAGFTLGNVYIFGQAGFVFRAGYNIPQDYGVSTIRPASTYGTPVNDDDPRLSASTDWSVYAFAGSQQRIVGHNIFLDGNTFGDSASIGKKNWVGDFSMGLGITTGPVMTNFTMNWRSNEFSGQTGGQWFGSIDLSMLF